MPATDTTDVITWPQFGAVCAISTLAATAVGLPIYAVSEFRGTSWLEMLLLIPLSIPLAMGISLVFSFVGALIGAIPMLLMRRRMPHARLVTWMTAGAALGGMIGASHPFVVLIAITDQFAGTPSLRGSLSFAALTGACGSVSGLLVGWWYRARVLGGRPGTAIAIEPHVAAHERRITTR